MADVIRVLGLLFLCGPMALVLLYMFWKVVVWSSDTLLGKERSYKSKCLILLGKEGQKRNLNFEGSVGAPEHQSQRWILRVFYLGSVQTSRGYRYRYLFLGTKLVLLYSLEKEDVKRYRDFCHKRLTKKLGCQTIQKDYRIPWLIYRGNARVVDKYYQFVFLGCFLTSLEEI